MVNVVIPMAGEGSRFKEAGYDTPKPFIEVDGRTLIEIVLDNLPVRDANFILIARTNHLDTQPEAVRRIENNYRASFVCVNELTEGAACTVLKVHRLINNETPLLLANSDQFVEFDAQDYIDDCQARNLDVSILTFHDEDRDPKWSFARTNRLGLVQEVKEKVPISSEATVGLYYFSRGSSFVNGAIDMIVANDRVNNEFYTCPVYNYCIAAGEKIGTFKVESRHMHGLGTPDDLAAYRDWLAS